MKKAQIIIVLILSLIITGCINYKTLPQETNQEILKELEQIEPELELGTQPADQETSAEVILTKTEVDQPLQTVTIIENQKISLKPKVNDPDNDPVTITYSTPLNQNGQWQTSYGDAGEYLATVTASDGTNIISKLVKIVVQKNNVAPIIENIKDLTINEGEAVNFQPQVSDANGDKILVSVSPPLNEELFQTDFTSAGVYQITVTVSDGELETVKTFALTVLNVNQKPVFKNLQDITIKEGEILRLTPPVEDLDGDKIELNISKPVGNDGLWELGFTDNGEYGVTLTASDGQETVTEKIKITVEDVNAPVEFIDIVVEIN